MQTITKIILTLGAAILALAVSFLIFLFGILFLGGLIDRFIVKLEAAFLIVAVVSAYGAIAVGFIAAAFTTFFVWKKLQTHTLQPTFKIIILAIASLILIIVFVYQFFFTQTPNKLADKARKDQNPQICEQTTDDYSKNRCYEKLIPALNSIDQCSSFGSQLNSNIGGSWKNSCYRHFAIKDKNGSYCNQIDNSTYPDCTDCYSKNKCFREMANLLKDHQLCNSVVDSNYKNRCFEEEAYNHLNPIICNNINNQSHRTECIIKIARKTEKPDFCNLIPEVFSQESCRNEINYLLQRN